MFPLMPLLLGAVTGAALVRLAQKGRHQHYVHQAKDKLRTATSSSLESLNRHRPSCGKSWSQPRL